MTFLKLCALGAFLMVLARMGGWRIPLPQVMIDTLSFRKPAGQTEDDSESDSGESDGSRSIAGGVAHVSEVDSWAAVEQDERPTLGERWTSFLERWSNPGTPERVLEAPVPEPTDRELQRQALVDHLLRERARTNPALPATRIVESAADQPDVPWGRVSRATVWRVWRELP